MMKGRIRAIINKERGSKGTITFFGRKIETEDDILTSSFGIEYEGRGEYPLEFEEVFKGFHLPDYKEVTITIDD